MKYFNSLIFFIFCTTSIAYSSFVTDTQSFTTGIENRVEYHEGNEKTVKKLIKLFSEANRKNGKISYEQPVFVPGKARLIVNNKSTPIHTFYPNFVDLCNFDDENFSGKLVYLKDGDLKNAKGIELKDSLVLLDFNCKENYYDLMTYGIKGFLFLEPENPEFESIREKILLNAVSIPRYQVPKNYGNWLVKLFNTNNSIKFSIESTKNKWEKRTLANVWSLIPGKDPELNKQVFIIKVNLDTFHYCPELISGGADNFNLTAFVKLFQKYHANPASYSILFHAVNSSYINNTGLSHLSHYSLGLERSIFNIDASSYSEEKYLLDMLAEAKAIISVYESLEPSSLSQEKIDNLISLIEQPAGRNIPMLNPIQRIMDFDIYNLEIKRFALYNSGKEESKEFAQIKEKMSDIGVLVDLFKKYGLGNTLKDLSDNDLSLLEYYRQQVLKKYQKEVNRAKKLIEKLEEVKVTRRALEGKKVQVAVGLHLTYGTDFVGLTSTSGHNDGDDELRQSNRKNLLYINLIGKQVEDFYKENAPSFKWASENKSFYQHWKDGGSRFYYRMGVPAFAIMNSGDLENKAWSSFDRIENYKESIVSKNWNIYQTVIDKILSFKETDKFIRERMTRGPNKEIGGASGFFTTRIKDGSSLTIPETPLANAIVSLHESNKFKINSEYHQIRSTIPYHLYVSDETGRVLYHNLAIKPEKSKVEVGLYHFNENYEIDLGLDQGSSTMKFKYGFATITPFLPEHMLAGVFGRKADIYGLISPLSLLPNKEFKFLSAGDLTLKDFSSSGLSPSGVNLRKGIIKDPIPGSIILPENQSVRIVFKDQSFLAGVQEGSRDNDTGYTASELHRKSLRQLFANDLKSLNRIRSEILTRNAVTNNLIDDFEKRTDEILEKDNSLNKDDYLSKTSVEQQYLGSETLLYPIINGTVTDMIKAVVFYLAVMLPFCFFFQKLVFNFVKIENQVLGFVGTFLGVYLIFHFIHPAFQIAKNPQIIIISFTTMLLVIFVSSIIRGKFDYHMNDFLGKFTNSDSNAMKLAGKAFIVGVSNMRRRKIRTTLTCVTIILITFTMLSFTSVTQKVSPTLINKEAASPYNGIFFSEIIWEHMSNQKIEALDNLLGHDSTQSIRRYRNLNRRQDNAKKIFLNSDLTKNLSNQKIEIQSILGLEAHEDGFIAKMPMLVGRFFKGEKNEIILSRKFLETYDPNFDINQIIKNPSLLKNKIVSLNNKELKLVGIIDTDSLKEIKDLRGLSIIPQEMIQTGTKINTENAETEVPEGSFKDVDIDSLVFVSAGTRDLDLITISYSVKYDTADKVWEKVRNLVSTTNLRYYFGVTDKFMIDPKSENPIYQNEGRYFLKSGFNSSFGGLASLLIPILVSATIIFNTMLSSVYERRKEIAIYNSIGLSPIHIGMFFITESIVYGIMGSVGGYLIGQVFAKVITILGFFQDLNINYSSLSVVYVILFTIFIVVVSSLYPAWVAIKTAAASSGRKKLQIENDNEIITNYPFSFNKKMVYAAHSYLWEYMDLHFDQSVGGFMAKQIKPPLVQNENTQQEIIYTYDISIAPFDLGVRINLEVTSYYNERVGAFMIKTKATRQAGSDSNFMSTYRPFADDLRKYLLRWRALEDDVHEEHYENAQKSLSSEEVVNV